MHKKAKFPYISSLPQEFFLKNWLPVYFFYFQHFFLLCDTLWDYMTFLGTIWLFMALFKTFLGSLMLFGTLDTFQPFLVLFSTSWHLKKNWGRWVGGREGYQSHHSRETFWWKKTFRKKMACNGTTHDTWTLRLEDWKLKKLFYYIYF